MAEGDSTDLWLFNTQTKVFTKTQVLYCFYTLCFNQDIKPNLQPENKKYTMPMFEKPFSDNGNQEYYNRQVLEILPIQRERGGGKLGQFLFC